MANAYTSSTGNLAGTAGVAGLVQKAYDRLLDFALRSEPLIRSVADKKPTKLANPGSTVVLQLYADLSEQTTALTESNFTTGKSNFLKPVATSLCTKVKSSQAKSNW